MKNISFFLLAIVLLLACKSKKNIESSANEKPFSDEQVAAINKRYPGVTANQLITGQSLYKTNCKKCHALKEPGNYNEAQWNKIMPGMAKKAKIDDVTKESILIYVLGLSKEQ